MDSIYSIIGSEAGTVQSERILAGQEAGMIRRWIREDLYPHWAVACLPMALLVGAFLVSAGDRLPLALAAVWLQMAVYLLHEFEEHAIPGGFKDYVNGRVAGPLLRRYGGGEPPRRDFPLDDASVFWINAIFILILFSVAAVAAGVADIRFGLLLPWIGIVNATSHLAVGLARREYNPGLAVSVAVNIPTGIATLVILSRAGAGLGWQLAAAAAAAVLHLGLIAWMLLKVRREVARAA
jgi:hypothetical protein